MTNSTRPERRGSSSEIAVLLVDDSPTARLAIRHVLHGEPGIRVVGEASSGQRALRMVQDLRPQLVTMDVHLGKDHGIEVAQQIMASCATPILVVTGVDPHNPDLAFRAMEAGALDVVPKPPAASSPDFPEYRRRLVRLVRSLSAVPVVTRRRRPSRRVEPAPRPRPAPRRPVLATSEACRLVAIGASTGGPPVLHSLLERLSAPYPAPIAVAQHIARGFVSGLASWLEGATGHSVRVCSRREPLLPGRVYLAADDCHLEVLSDSEIGSVPGPPRDFQRPSVNVLFEGASKHLGPHAAGFLLTGMGSDGVEGLLALRQAGAPTFAQAPPSCAVDAMPRNAIERGAAAWTLAPPDMVGALEALVRQPEASPLEALGPETLVRPLRERS